MWPHESVPTDEAIAATGNAALSMHRECGRTPSHDEACAVVMAGYDPEKIDRIT